VRRKKRELNTIWETGFENPNFRWCFLTPAGAKYYHPSKEGVEQKRANWKPQITQLYSMGYIKAGDTLELVFSGYDERIPLEIKGRDRKSMVFYLPDGRGEIKLIDIKKKIRLETGSFPVLDCKKTIHVESGLSLEGLKSLCKNSPEQEYPDKDPKQLNLLEILDGQPEEAETEVCESSPSMDILPLDDFAEFKDDFDIYSNNQASFINSMDRFSNEDKKTLWKKNLINMLSLNM
jgi:hypothetical protein